MPYPHTPFWNFWVYRLAVHIQANVSSDKQHIFEEQCGLEERVWVTCVASGIVFVHVSFCSAG